METTQREQYPDLCEVRGICKQMLMAFPRINGKVSFGMGPAKANRPFAIIPAVNIGTTDQPNIVPVDFSSAEYWN